MSIAFHRLLLQGCCLVLFSCAGTKQYQQVSKKALHDKVSGAWAGKMFGVMYGRQMEFKALGHTYDDVIPWKPEMIEQSLVEDDIYGQLSFMMAMEKTGLHANAGELADVFAHAGFPLCHANLQARKNYLDGIRPPMTGHPVNSMHADDIDFQIESDFIGFIHPGMPQAAAAMCDRIGRIMAYGDGLYGGMYLSAMHTQAYFDNDVYSVVTKALQAIPANSKYAQCIQDVLAAYKADPNDWRKAWQRIQQKWGNDDSCIPYHAFNIDAKINGAFITIGLLYGRGALQPTMEITIRCGQDTDCNSANAAAVIGIMQGLSGIPATFISYLPQVADKNFLHTTYSYNKTVQQTIRFIEQAIVENGGRISAESYYIKKQSPVFKGILEQSYPQEKMAYQVEVKDSAAWQFSGNWTNFVYGDGDPDLFKLAGTPGDSVSFRFTGTGISLLGAWNTTGGRADVYIDGRLVKQIDTYYKEEAGKYDVNRAHIFHQMGLSNGDHHLKLVVAGQRNPLSQGDHIWLQRAVIFKKDNQ